MNAMNLRSQLQAKLDAFYAQALADARQGFEPHLDTLSAPFLLNVSEDYLVAPVRVMFIGKETNGWYHKLRMYYETADALASLKLRYAEQFRRSTASSAFLRRTRALAGDLAGGKRTAICWNNVMKMDWNQGNPNSRNSINHSRELFDFSVATVRHEIEVLKPDVVIFGTGHRYDRAVHAVLPSRETVYKEPRRLWHFRSEGMECYRTFHPGARKNAAPRPIEHYYADIVASVRTELQARLSFIV